MRRPLIRTVSVSRNIAAAGGALAIGGNSVWGEWFEGLIDEVRVYNRVLSEAQIQSDMNAPLQQGVSSDEVLVPQRPVKGPAKGAARRAAALPAPAIEPAPVVKRATALKPAPVVRPTARPFPFARSPIWAKAVKRPDLLK